MNRSKEDSLGPVYEWLEGAESLERYAEGGYHPVKLDDEFCAGRYHVVHKLGKGSYSTVWLARDRQANRYVALKILVSEIPTPSSESHILHGLAKHRKSIPNLAGGHHVLELLDEFTIIGPNGQHTCLVTEPLGCSIGASREASSIWLFQLQVARAIAAKLITGVHFLHSADVVHGDLHSNNIMLKLPNMDTLSTEELYSQYGSSVWLVSAGVHQPVGRCAIRHNNSS